MKRKFVGNLLTKGGLSWRVALSLLVAPATQLRAELTASQMKALESQLPLAESKTIDFYRDIKPIFETTCFRCHGPEKPKSNFRLDNRASALKGGKEGIDIIPNHSAESPL